MAHIEQNPSHVENKKVIYQVFTRLFGNDNTNNKPWGTIDENGVGKFNDFTDKALGELKTLGVTHMWYTGILHHATITDYSKYNISNDDPNIVKGRAGSPYAVKDYYSVNPDLAIDPSRGLEEFQQLIERTHKAGMKVIIDIIPNHVARNYEGKANPTGVKDFGADDDKNVTYKRDNNFYYIVGENFKVPDWKKNYAPLGGDTHPMADGKFEEIPAKWTGNGSRLAQPDANDWYETIKINYGVRPDNTKDFDELPSDYRTKEIESHVTFWNDKVIPDSWNKFKDIAFYWLEKGVDGLRFDMAEMVPVEFWSYLNSNIKKSYPNTLLLAEVYNPNLYRDYIHLGKMDYLYDKVGFYDTIKHIVQGHGKTDNLPQIQNSLADIEHHMVHFLENHDEQRIASPDFAGSAIKGKPAMVVSTTVSTSPTLIYFGQEVGEPGIEEAGFGDPTRTSIYDYIGVPHHQRWMNNKEFDGGQSSLEEKNLRDFYKRLLNFTINSDALMGEYQEIHHMNKNSGDYNHKLFSFVRWSNKEKLIIVSNFDENRNYSFELKIPRKILSAWNIKNGQYIVKDQLYGTDTFQLSVTNGFGIIQIDIEPLGSYILSLPE